jgi:SsrA-binding protein
MKAVYNKKATFDYEILQKFEAGLVLTGQEVKAIKNNQINLKGAYVSLRYEPAPELFLIKAHVSPYVKAGPLPDYDPERPRKLLLKKQEIKGLLGKLEQKGLTIVPLSVYTKRNLVKLSFGLAKGKKKYQKKEQKKNRDIDKEISRTLKYQ